MKSIFQKFLFQFFHKLLPVLFMIMGSVSFFGGYIVQPLGKRFFGFVIFVNIVGGYFLYLFYLNAFSTVMNILDYDVTNIEWLPTYILNIFMIIFGYVFAYYFKDKGISLAVTIKKISIIFFLTYGVYYSFIQFYDYFDFLLQTKEFFHLMDNATPEQNKEFMQLLYSK